VAAGAPLTALEARFDAHLEALALPGGTGLVGVSGGPDSLTLLHLLARSPAAGHLDLAVVHVDHGIHPDSAAVAARVAEAARRVGLVCEVERAQLGPGTSETRARAARYAAFRRALARRGADLLFLAHHADDQLETLLMRFLRGSGPAGLAGMPARRGPFVRPLLPFRRAELRAAAAALGLEPWDDPANRDPRHDRAWLRHEVLPGLEGRWPGLPVAVVGAGRAFAADREAWDEVLNALPDLDFQPEADAASVAAPSLRGYSSGLARALLRALARRIGATLSSRHLDQVQAMVAQGHSGRHLDLGAGLAAEIAFGRLRLFRAATHPVGKPLRLEGSQGTGRFGSWTLAWRPEPAPDGMGRGELTTWVPADAGLVVRPWRPGDRIRPLGGRGSRPVVRCMQERRVPRGARVGWPVLERDGEVVWVPGVCRSERFVPAGGTQSVRIDARRE
jgi:tRNA(Ile)-lysidine synthase